MVPTTQPETIEAYAVRAFEQFKLGRASVDDGVLLVVARDDRAVRIEVGYGLEGTIPDVTAHRVIQEYLVPKFREGDFAGGIAKATTVLAGLINGGSLPAPMSAAVQHDYTTSDSDDPIARGLMELMFAGFITAFIAAALGAHLSRRTLAVIFAIVAGVVSFGMWAQSEGAYPFWFVFLGAAMGCVIGYVFGALAAWFGGNSNGSSHGGRRSGGGPSRRSSSSRYSGGGGRSGGGGASGSW